MGVREGSSGEVVLLMVQFFLAEAAAVSLAQRLMTYPPKCTPGSLRPFGINKKTSISKSVTALFIDLLMDVPLF
jgi:hypothetical protein